MLSKKEVKEKLYKITEDYNEELNFEVKRYGGNIAIKAGFNAGQALKLSKKYRVFYDLSESEEKKLYEVLMYYFTYWRIKNGCEEVVYESNRFIHNFLEAFTESMKPTSVLLEDKEKGIVFSLLKKMEIEDINHIIFSDYFGDTTNLKKDSLEKAIFSRVFRLEYVTLLNNFKLKELFA